MAQICIRVPTPRHHKADQAREKQTKRTGESRWLGGLHRPGACAASQYWSFTFPRLAMLGGEVLLCFLVLERRWRITLSLGPSLGIARAAKRAGGSCKMRAGARASFAKGHDEGRGRGVKCSKLILVFWVLVWYDSVSCLGRVESMRLTSPNHPAHSRWSSQLLPVNPVGCPSTSGCPSLPPAAATHLSPRRRPALTTPPGQPALLQLEMKMQTIITCKKASPRVRLFGHLPRENHGPVPDPATHRTRQALHAVP